MNYDRADLIKHANGPYITPGKENAPQGAAKVNPHIEVEVSRSNPMLVEAAL